MRRLIDKTIKIKVSNTDLQILAEEVANKINNTIKQIIFTKCENIRNKNIKLIPKPAYSPVG